MKVFYKVDSTLHNNCFCFYSSKNRGTFTIAEKEIGECSYNLPTQLQNDIRSKKIKYGNWISELNECLNYASDFYVMDSLSSIFCSTIDFPEAAIYISEKEVKYTHRTKFRERILKAENETDILKGMNIISRVQKNYREYIESCMKVTEIRKEMNNLLHSFNLKVDKIKVDPEVYTGFMDRKLFMKHLTDTTNITVPDSILYVPLQISVVSSK